MHRCHKVVLAQSPFLKSLLIDDDKDDEAKIFTPYVPGSIVSLILDALYKGEVTSSSWPEYELLRESLINLQVIGSVDCFCVLLLDLNQFNLQLQKIGPLLNGRKR